MRVDTTTPKGWDRCGLKELKMPSVQPRRGAWEGTDEV